jgi:hypothetical protein
LTRIFLRSSDQKKIALLSQKPQPGTAVSSDSQISFAYKTVLYLDCLIADNDCCLTLLVSRKSEVVGWQRDL